LARVRRAELAGSITTTTTLHIHHQSREAHSHQTQHQRGRRTHLERKSEGTEEGGNGVRNMRRIETRGENMREGVSERVTLEVRRSVDEE